MGSKSEAQKHYGPHYAESGESLKTALPSQKGYLIRPYVELTGLRDGYFLKDGEKGHWRAFLDSKKKHFTLQNTGLCNIFIISISSAIILLKNCLYLLLKNAFSGRKSNYNLEGLLANTYFYGESVNLDKPTLKELMGNLKLNIYFFKF